MVETRHEERARNEYEAIRRCESYGSSSSLSLNTRRTKWIFLWIRLMANNYECSQCERTARRTKKDNEEKRK